jgi:hypothetical protein
MIGLQHPLRFNATAEGLSEGFRLVEWAELKG